MSEENKVTAEFDYEKLEKIVSSRTEQVVQNIFKSFATENNMKLDELKEQYSKIQEGQKVEDVKETDTYKELMQQYEALQNTVKTEKTDAEINKIATDAGLTKEQTEFVRKTLSNDIYKEDGSLNSEKITEEIKKVGQLFGVELKGNVGYSGKDDNGNKKLELESELERLRKRVGLIK